MLNWLVVLFCFLLPAGWAKHWLTEFSLVNGVLVDYLMPDIWIQDLLAIIIIIFNFRKLKFRVNNYLLPITLIFISIVFSQIPLISLISFWRFLLAFTLGWLLAENKKIHQSVRRGLAGAVIWTTFLAVGQLINQGTLIGWKFLGEPIFSLGSGGIKKMSVLGIKFLAPMATFPHANVMGAFGLLAFIIFFKSRNKEKFKIARLFSFILAVLSFSIPIYLVLLYLIVPQLLGVKSKVKEIIIWGISCLLFLIILWRVGFLELNSFYRRWKLIKASLGIIGKNFWLGVGWGTFVKKLADYKTVNFLQPVHNVFLLVLSELGLVGTSGLVFLIRELYKGLKIKDKKQFLLFCFSALLLFSLDHYFWTTTQGIYMLWVMTFLL